MGKKTFSACLLTIGLFLQTTHTFSQQNKSISWNQFRGHERAGVSTETGLPDKLPENGPEMLWKKELGSGFSEITVEGDTIYTMLGESGT